MMQERNRLVKDAEKKRVSKKQVRALPPITRQRAGSAHSVLPSPHAATAALYLSPAAPCPHASSSPPSDNTSDPPLSLLRRLPRSSARKASPPTTPVPTRNGSKSSESARRTSGPGWPGSTRRSTPATPPKGHRRRSSSSSSASTGATMLPPTPRARRAVPRPPCLRTATASTRRSGALLSTGRGLMRGGLGDTPLLTRGLLR